MSRVKKSGLLVALAAIALGAMIFTVKIVNTSQFKSQIPELHDTTAMSAPLIEQLSNARNTALLNPSSDNLGMLGMAFHSSAFYEKALQCYKLAIKKNNSKWVWRYYSGYIYKELGDSKAAADNFANVTSENPEVYLAWYYLGKAYQNIGLEDKAEEVYKKIAYLHDNLTSVKTLRVNYSSVQSLAKFELARIDLYSNKTDDAEKLLLGIVKTNRSIGPVYRLLGNVYSAKGDSDLSRKYVIRAQDLPIVTSIADTLADKLTLMSRSELYLLREIDDALKSANPAWGQELLRHALQYLPDDKYLVSKAIKFYLRMGMGMHALPILDKHRSFFRNDPNELTEVAEMLYNNGFYSQSIPYFAKIAELRPQDNEVQASYALSCWKDNRKEAALLIMDELFQKNKKDYKVLANEVAFMIITGDKDKAEAFHKILRKAAPNDAKVPKLAAMIAESDGNQMKAISLYEASFNKDPDDLETISKLGNLLLSKQMWDKAVKFFRSALDHHPNEPPLLEHLGTLLVSSPDPKYRNMDEGMEFAERAFFHISSPSNTIISAAKTLAQAYAVKGEFREATYYIIIAINIAQEVNAPKDYIEGLRQLEARIKYASQKK